jgi:S-DNA-T family DNA segregation ATPase FtsK/SpoIIIE
MAVSAAPTPNIAPLLAGIAIVAGAGISLLRLPGGVVALLLLAIAAWMSTAPPMTGKKDAAGYPTVGNPGEERAVLRHRSWSYMRWRLIFPSSDWLLNDPGQLKDINGRADKLSALLPARLQKVVAGAKVIVFLVWLLVPSSFLSMAAIGAAMVALTLPVDGLDVWGVAPGAGLWLMWPNAIATYVIIVQIAAARRRFAAISDPRPPVTVSHLVAACRKRERRLLAVGFAAAGVTAITVTAVLVALYALNVAWLISPAPVAAAGAGVVCAAMFLRAQSLPEARVDWENTVEARAGWVTNWQTLKVDPEPYMLSHVRLGDDDQLPVHVDTFEAPATLGSAGALGMLAKIAPTRGAGMRVSVLNEPDVDAQGQPISGSKHPLRFTVVSWPVDTKVDITDPAVDRDLVRMMVRTAAAANTGGWPQPMLLDITPVFVDESGEGEEQEGGSFSTAAYATYWGAPDVDCTNLMPSVAGGAAGYMGAEAIADPESPNGACLYVGALTSGTTSFSDETLGERFEVLAREAEWDERWTNVLKMGEQRPWIQSALWKTSSLASGQVVESQPFMTPQGIPSELYITAEKERRLQSTLNNAPFVAVIGWPIDSDRPGERHPGAFRVLWSTKAIPSNPALIPPGTSGPSGDAVKWALAAALNEGFDAAKLPRGELISSAALTSRQSSKHIWDLTVRLYGGVTLLAVKAAAEKIRQGMGAAEWLRITGHAEGARIVVGASPQASGLQFSRPRNKSITTALDWEQVFIDAKLVSPVDGSAPKLAEATTLETNKDVESLTFTVPRGLSITDFQEPKAVDRMRVNARKVFIDVRHTDAADTMRLLVCEVDPMPMPAPFMWDEMGDKTRSNAFATNVEGAPVVWDLDLDSHLLILGSNGSGKGIAATSLLTDMLMSCWDVYAGDPSKGFNDFAFADPWLKLRAADYPDTVAIARKMVDLLEERKRLNSQYGVSNIKDLPDDVRPPITCMFIDEFTSLIIPEVVPKLGDNPTEQDLQEHTNVVAINSAKAVISAAIGRILREGRATGLVMVLMGQKLTADILRYVPGGNTLKSQMSRLAMGKMNFGDMMSAFNDAAGALGILGPSVPRGRGIFESTAQAAFAVQTWWGGGSQTEHFQAMVDHIAERRSPLQATDRFDPEPYRPAAVDNTPVFGRRIDGSGDVQDDEIVDVGVVDLGIDFGEFDVDVPGVDSDPDINAADSESDQDLLVEGSPPATAPPEAEKVEVTFVGPGAPADDPSHVDVDELSPGPPATGSPAVDAMCAWVGAHPNIRTVRWVSPLSAELDEIGISHGELAESAFHALGVTDVQLIVPGAHGNKPGGLARVEPAERAGFEESRSAAETIQHAEPPVAGDPSPMPALLEPPAAAATPRAPAVLDDDLFDTPASPVHITDNLFD